MHHKGSSNHNKQCTDKHFNLAGSKDAKLLGIQSKRACVLWYCKEQTFTQPTKWLNGSLPSSMNTYKLDWPREYQSARLSAMRQNGRPTRMPVPPGTLVDIPPASSLSDKCLGPTLARSFSITFARPSTRAATWTPISTDLNTWPALATMLVAASKATFYLPYP